MTNYKNIFGKPVKFLATDPDNAEAEGQIWYNSTDGAFKDVIVSEAWSSGSPLINAKQNNSGDGTQTAALSVGGSFPSNMADFEEYNGSGWSSQPNVPYDAQMASTCGTQTAAVTFGGTNPTNPREATTIEYNGTSWTAGGSLNTAKSGSAGAGTQTATLSCQGSSVPSAATNITEEYNGSAWTTVNNTVTTKRNNPAAFGTQTAAVGAIGGGDPSENPTNTSEEYDGTSWTASATINTSRLNLSGTGNNTAGLIHGGATGVGGGPNTGATEKWDGSSWTTTSSMATARNQKEQRAGSSSAALAFSGYDGSSPSSVTEEFNRSVNVITAAAFSTGGSLPVGKQGFGGAGTRSASLIFGGYIGGPGATGYVATTEEYNGSSWSGGGAMPTSRSNPIGFGTQTAGVAFAGIDNVPVYITSGDHYDGSTWTATPNNYPSNASNASSCGTQTAGLAANGYNGTAYLNTSNEYDGTSWTASGTVPVSWSGRGTGGIQTSAIIFGGTDGGSPFPASGQSQSDEYNGSTWTTVPSLTSGRIYPHGTGNTNADNVRSMGGRLASPAGTPTTQHLIYDGTVWSTQPSMTTARQQAGITVYSSTPEAMVAGGNDGSFVTATEEFTPETSALNIKTITTS